MTDYNDSQMQWSPYEMDMEPYAVDVVAYGEAFALVDSDGIIIDVIERN